MRGLAIPLALSLVVGCSDGTDDARALCALVDASGTYADERARAVELLSRVLVSELRAGDTVIVGSIDARSYDPDNITLQARIGERPSMAVRQRAAVVDALDGLAASGESARYTDISGGMMMCRDLLAEAKASNRSVLLLSDLVEDLKPGDIRDLEGDALSGIRVTAINVKRMERDQRDPKAYEKRITEFRERVLAGGASGFEVVSTPARLKELL